MPTESSTGSAHKEGSGGSLVVDTLQTSDQLLERVAVFEQENTRFVEICSAFESLGSTRLVVMAMRASNIGCVLKLSTPVEAPTIEEVRVAVSELKDWDQLLLSNVIVLLKEHLPEAYVAALQNEARIEDKWFREWSAAIVDSRIAKYPGLPWRKFIRKTVMENHRFANGFLEAAPQEIEGLVEAFLKEKKQAVCLFPKQWRRLGKRSH